MARDVALTDDHYTIKYHTSLIFRPKPFRDPGVQRASVSGQIGPGDIARGPSENPGPSLSV